MHIQDHLIQHESQEDVWFVVEFLAGLHRVAGTIRSAYFF